MDVAGRTLLIPPCTALRAGHQDRLHPVPRGAPCHHACRRCPSKPPASACFVATTASQPPWPPGPSSGLEGGVLLGVVPPRFSSRPWSCPYSYPPPRCGAAASLQRRHRSATDGPLGCLGHLSHTSSGGETSRITCRTTATLTWWYARRSATCRPRRRLRLLRIVRNNQGRPPPDRGRHLRLGRQG
jgi:hypothetical protein